MAEIVLSFRKPTTTQKCSCVVGVADDQTGSERRGDLGLWLPRNREVAAWGGWLFPGLGSQSLPLASRPAQGKPRASWCFRRVTHVSEMWGHLWGRPGPAVREGGFCGCSHAPSHVAPCGPAFGTASSCYRKSPRGSTLQKWRKGPSHHLHLPWPLAQVLWMWLLDTPRLLPEPCLTSPAHPSVPEAWRVRLAGGR